MSDPTNETTEIVKLACCPSHAGGNKCRVCGSTAFGTFKRLLRCLGCRRLVVKAEDPPTEQPVTVRELLGEETWQRAKAKADEINDQFDALFFAEPEPGAPAPTPEEMASLRDRILGRKPTPEDREQAEREAAVAEAEAIFRKARG